MNYKEQVIILSAELESQTKTTNEKQTKQLETYLRDAKITFKKGRGTYKNFLENNFICLPKNDDDITFLKNIAFEVFEQESILYRDSNNQTHLFFNNGKETYLGKLKVGKKEVNKDYIELNNVIYVVD